MTPGAASGRPDPRRDGNLGYWCRRACERFPDRTAMIDLSRTPPRRVSYREMDERMDRVASLLESAGARPGEPVALGVGNRFEFVELMFGIMRRGAVPVPLNYKLGAEALGHVVTDSGCRAAFVDADAAPRAAHAVEDAGIATRWHVGAPARADAGAPRPGWQDYEAALSTAPARFDPPALPRRAVAFLPYTSGSTGKPKGVVLPHEGQVWWVRCLEKYWPADPSERALVAVPLYHKNAMAGAVKPLLQAGGSVVIQPGFVPEPFLRALSEHRCTRVSAVPAVFAMALRCKDLIARLDFSTLRTVTLGSAPVQPELLHAVSRAFGVDVGESYGLTEGGPVMLGPPVDGTQAPVGSCGAAWPEAEVKLVQDGAEHPSDGELWVRNPGVAAEYRNLPGLTAARIKDGWLATGDLFHRDPDGFFFFRGRDDDMFNSGGENVYPKEVEDLLLSHPAVLDAVVVPVPHAVKGHVPGAVVVAAPESGATPDALKRHALEHGPAYAHPRRVVLVDAVPLTGAGKPDRHRVAELLQADAAPRRQTEDPPASARPPGCPAAGPTP